jgi:hypothetical protein
MTDKFQWMLVGVFFGFLLCGALVAFADRFNKNMPS